MFSDAAQTTLPAGQIAPPAGRGQALNGRPDASLLRPGEVRGYPRKSTAGENASKSLGDQEDVIFEVAEENGLPLGAADILREKAGHGGEEWWEGGGTTGLGYDASHKPRTRPALTELMRGVVAGEIKCVIVWAQDRLWRNVGIADAIMDIFARYGVLLYDRNGPVDIHTPEGRSNARTNANASQHYREMCSVNVKRGTAKNLKKGNLSTGSDALGFRSGGRYSREVVHRPDEQETVRRIFRMFLFGEDGGEPMRVLEIGRTLAAENYAWTPDLIEKRAVKRNEYTKNSIYDWQIKRVLRDVRYIGQQPHLGQGYPCKAFLVDGNPVVDPAIFQRAQEKLANNSRTGNAGLQKRALTGLFRCGLCGQNMNVNPCYIQFKDGARGPIPYWGNTKHNAWCWCTHTLPHVRETTLDSYIDDVLAPLLLAEVRELAEMQSGGDTLAARASLERILEEEQRKHIEEIRPLLGKVTPELIAGLEKPYLERISRVKQELQEAESRVRELERHRHVLEDSMPALSSLSRAARRDFIRAVLRWVAIWPSNQPRVPTPGRGKQTSPHPDVGTLLFLTAWGTYHTAKIERAHTGETDHRQLVLRPAMASEQVGTVANLPDPEAFIAGLRRGYASRKYEFDPADVVPGYSASGETPLLADFEC